MESGRQTVGSARSELTRRLTSTSAAFVPALAPPPKVAQRERHHDSVRDNASTSATSHSALHDLIAGGVAGSCGIAAGHPLDSLKVRMQMSSSAAGGSSQSRSLVGVARTMPSNALWKGIGAPVAMAAVLNASIFLTLGETKRLWDVYNLNDDSGDLLLKNCVCGGITGVVSAITMCPTEHVKTKLQTQLSGKSSPSSNLYRNSFQAAHHILRHHGVVGLYRGFIATVLRQGPGFVAYFGAYDGAKTYLRREHFPSEKSMMPSVLAGGLAGSLSWAVVYPVDLIKSRIQASAMDCPRADRSMGRVLRDVVRKGGLTALYRGFGITVFRAFPVNAIIFPMYELTLRSLQKL